MSGWRKRQKPYFSLQQQQPPLSKRQRPEKAAAAVGVEEGREMEEKSSKQASVVVVSGLPRSSTAFELKSRFQMFGAVSRLRIDNGLGYVTFRSKESAQAAISASLDPSSGISIQSVEIRQSEVQVSWANDPVPQWKAAVRASSTQDCRLPSKLLRPEIPLSGLGRGNRKLSAGTAPSTTSSPELAFKGCRRQQRGYVGSVIVQRLELLHNFSISGVKKYQLTKGMQQFTGSMPTWEDTFTSFCTTFISVAVLYAVQAQPPLYAFSIDTDQVITSQ
ncbi:hypothetical protein ACLOJK_020850 [Asimina triloba]